MISRQNYSAILDTRRFLVEFLRNGISSSGDVLLHVPCHQPSCVGGHNDGIQGQLNGDLQPFSPAHCLYTNNFTSPDLNLLICKMGRLREHMHTCWVHSRTTAQGSQLLPPLCSHIYSVLTSLPVVIFTCVRDCPFAQTENPLKAGNSSYAFTPSRTQHTTFYKVHPQCIYFFYDYVDLF